jgi:ABC-type nickel/cobalt efflux system permease component RcnA
VTVGFAGAAKTVSAISLVALGAQGVLQATSPVTSLTPDHLALIGAVVVGVVGFFALLRTFRREVIRPEAKDVYAEESVKLKKAILLLSKQVGGVGLVLHDLKGDHDRMCSGGKCPVAAAAFGNSITAELETLLDMTSEAEG